MFFSFVVFSGTILNSSIVVLWWLNYSHDCVFYEAVGWKGWRDLTSLAPLNSYSPFVGGVQIKDLYYYCQTQQYNAIQCVSARGLTCNPAFIFSLPGTNFIAVISHSGFSLSAGHYIAYVRAPQTETILRNMAKVSSPTKEENNPVKIEEDETMWYECDDDMVSLLPEERFRADTFFDGIEHALHVVLFADAPRDYHLLNGR